VTKITGILILCIINLIIVANVAFGDNGVEGIDVSGIGETSAKTQHARGLPAGENTRNTLSESPERSVPDGYQKQIARASSSKIQELARLMDIRAWSNPDYTRVAVTLDHEVRYSWHKLKRSENLPERIYIDITGARTASGIKDVPIGDGMLKMARTGQFRPNVVRVVLDIENIREFKIFPLSDPFRIIIDVKGERKTEISRLDESIKAPVTEGEFKLESEHQERVNVKEKLKLQKIRRIVIDPGHGGSDPGALGSDGSKEKDVVLAIATKLARKIEQETGIDTVLTRSTDVFIPLEERTAIANKVNADLFVSVHANASLNKSASGIETYYLNLAKTDKAVRVAARENNTSIEKVGLLQTILFDLMANHKINDSARLADEVQKSLCARVSRKYEGVKNLGVKQGPFYVLVGATMPSILVETAFISNDQESELLKDRDYQEMVAAGILDGIRGYIKALH
jgi:N-acetylmuramoyl-L-alanine amidase